MANLEKVTNWRVAVERVDVVGCNAHRERVEHGGVGKRGIHAACVFVFDCFLALALALPLGLGGGLGWRGGWFCC